MTVDPPKIAKYLSKRLDYLQVCHVEIEDHLSSKLFALANSDAPQSDIAATFFQLEHVIGNTFRYSMFIAVVTFLEETLIALSKLKVPSYDAKVRAIRNVNWLTRHRQLLEAEADVSFDSVTAEYDSMVDFVIIRNVLAHTWGNIPVCKNPTGVRDIIKRYEFLEEYADGHLFIADTGVPTVLVAAGEIADHMMSELFGIPIF